MQGANPCPQNILIKYQELEMATGEWVRKGWTIKCPNCQEDLIFMKKNYCPNCGARMGAQKQNEPQTFIWTPITEKEPDTADHVLVTLKHGEDDYEVCELDYGVDKACGGWLWRRVIAWSRKPKPFQD